MDCQYKNGCIKDNKKGWTNVVGYGNIMTTTISSNNNFIANNRQVPWNRIEPLSRPVTTPINPDVAWSPPVTQDMYNLVNKECNLCPVEDAFNSLLEPKKSITTLNQDSSPKIKQNFCGK